MRTPVLGRSIRSFICVAFIVSACSSRQSLPPGDALEDDADSTGEMTKTLPPPPPPDADEQKFAADLERRDEPLKQAEEKPAPMPEPVVAKVDDSEARAKEEAASGLSAARSLLSRGDTAGVQQKLSELKAVVKDAGPEAEQKFFELEFLLNLKTLDSDLAEKAAWAWLRSCGPASVDSCRSKALGAVSKLPKPSSALKKRIAAVKEHDACVKLTETRRNADKPPPCADVAHNFYKKDGDRLMLQRLKLAVAIAAASKAPPDSSAVQAFENAEKTCTDARCFAQRRNAYKWLMRVHQQSDDVEAVARVALLDARLFATTLPPDRRLWARTPELDQACEAFDKKIAAGACRRLEREVAGEYTYRDFSQKQERGEGLSPEAVHQVNSHYAISLEPCLAAHAKRLTPPASESHEVRWTVGNDGRVTQVSLRRKEQDAGPLGQCLRQQFTLWRYPRYRGELQHVEQVFMVHARERR